MEKNEINGRYFYLMLKENFYDSDDMVLLESMENGYLYSNILLKLYLKSLKDKGRLMYKDRIPYNVEMLAKLTRHNTDVVRRAIQIFKDMGIIEILDNGAIFMLDIENYIGKSSTEADRRRKYDRRIADEKKQLLSCEKSHEVSHENSCEKSHEHIDIESDIDIDTNINIYKEENKKEENKKGIEILNNEFEALWANYPNKQGKASALKSYIKARIKDKVDYDTIKDGLEKYLVYCQQNKDWYKTKNGSTWFNQQSWNDEYPLKQTTTKDVAERINLSSFFD